MPIHGHLYAIRRSHKKWWWPTNNLFMSQLTSTYPSHPSNQIVITAREFDAISVNQATRIPAVALPSGTSSLPPEVAIRPFLIHHSNVLSSPTFHFHLGPSSPRCSRSWNSFKKSTYGWVVTFSRDRQPIILPRNSAWRDAILCGMCVCMKWQG